MCLQQFMNFCHKKEIIMWQKFIFLATVNTPKIIKKIEDVSNNVTSFVWQLVLWIIAGLIKYHPHFFANFSFCHCVQCNVWLYCPLVIWMCEMVFCMVCLNFLKLLGIGIIFYHDSIGIHILKLDPQILLILQALKFWWLLA